MSTSNVRSAKNIIQKLWEKSANNFDTDELNWLSNTDGAFENELYNLAETIESVGCLVVSDQDTESLKNSNSVAMILDSLNDHLNTLAGLLHIASSAKDRLYHPENYAPVKTI